MVTGYAIEISLAQVRKGLLRLVIVLMSLEDEIRRRRCRRLRQRRRPRCAERGPGRRAGRRLLGRQRRDTGIIPLSVRVVVGGPADSGGVALAGDAFSHADAARRAVEIAFHIARLARPAVAVPAEASRAALGPGRGRLLLLLLLPGWRSSCFYCCCCCRHRRGRAVTADSVPGHGGGAGGRSRLADPGRHVDKTDRSDLPRPSYSVLYEGGPVLLALGRQARRRNCLRSQQRRRWRRDVVSGNSIAELGLGLGRGWAMRPGQRGKEIFAGQRVARPGIEGDQCLSAEYCAVLCSACWSAAPAQAVQGLSWGRALGMGS